MNKNISQFKRSSESSKGMSDNTGRSLTSAPKKIVKNSFSQNYLHSANLIRKLIVGKTRINKEDTVLDIGCGNGIIAGQLAGIVKKVIAYDIDHKNIELAKANVDSDNVEFLTEDFTKANIKKYGLCKVFSNIPFFLTANIVRKLFIENRNVTEAYLVMERDAAYRFIGKPLRSNSMMSVLLNSFYKIEIIYQFQKSDFKPMPKAEIVLVKFVRNKEELPFFQLYYDFVAYVFNERKNKIRNALDKLFVYEKLKRFAQNNQISLLDSSSQITVAKWKLLYNEFLKVDRKKQIIVMDSYLKLMRHQEKLNQMEIKVNS